MRPTLAVIGFRNLGVPEADWISTALSEMLRNELAIGDQLITIPGENIAGRRHWYVTVPVPVHGSTLPGQPVIIVPNY